MMMKTIPMIAVAALGVLSGAFAAERAPALKEGPARQLVENLCVGCHSLDYIGINAPFMNRQIWTAEVTKMVNVFGAPIPPNDQTAIVDYLTANYGVK